MPRQQAQASGQPSGPASPQKPKQAAEEGPSDNEVEEALSGLTEMAQAQTGPAEQSPKPGPAAQSPKPGPAASQPAQPAAQKKEAPGPQSAPAGPSPSGEASEDSAEERRWSMEELRKNLTNMDRDS